jgi:phosphoribosylamine--glycine ligase
LCDGKTALEIGTAQDHKRAFDGDRGPNTGGMGAYSPAPRLDAAMVERVMAGIVRPTLAGMAAEGAPFTGILYAGLMLTAEGPKLIEYNVRFGDPECQVVLPRLMTDLAQLLLGAVDGMLGHMDLRWLPAHALTVVLAARGYPGEPTVGGAIRGLEPLAGEPDLLLFHAGTRRDGDGTLRAAGGRVLDVTGLGATLAEARARAYAAVDRIDWPEGFCRRDIGWRALGG